jgi:hypothetical protein
MGLARSLLEIQHTAGNRAVGRLLGAAPPPPQAKLRIGEPGGAAEREAGRVAGAVGGTLAPRARSLSISQTRAPTGAAGRRFVFTSFSRR